MTVLNPPLHMQNRTDHPAVHDRQLIKSMYRFSGLGQFGDLAVTQQGSPNMSVLVGSGMAVMAGTENANQGSYLGLNDAAITVNVTASNPSLPRIDVIVARVQDQAYSTSNNFWEIVCVAGTPNASPVAPSPGNNALVIAEILVGANVTTILNANITMKAKPVRVYQQHWQLSSNSDQFELYDSAGVLIGAMDSTGHFKSFGVTGGATKARKPILVLRATTWSTPNGTTTKVPWGAGNDHVNIDGLFDDTNDRATIQTAGIYRVSAGITWTAHATPYRAASIWINDSQHKRQTEHDTSVGGLEVCCQVHTVVALNANDFVDVRGLQTSGAALGMATNVDWPRWLELEWLAPLT